MRIHVKFQRHPLRFSFPAGTSRGVLHTKLSWFVIAINLDDPSQVGIGECSIIPDLSIDDRADFETQLRVICHRISKLPFDWKSGWMDPEYLLRLYTLQLVPEEFPAIRFGVETALMDLLNGGTRTVFNTPFSQGGMAIPINGLVWMNTPQHMWQQVQAKVQAGFSTIKLKIGALNWQQELKLLRDIRAEYGDSLTLRVDANGAFAPDAVMPVLEELAKLNVHSVEQPIAHGQVPAMRQLCRDSPVPIALDEELIPLTQPEMRLPIIEEIKPQYLILKPSLLGGFASCMQYIGIAQQLGIGWWATSALESNIGLNAIAQFTSQYSGLLPQGLGTGGLFENNIESPLEVKQGTLSVNPALSWNYEHLNLGLA